MPHRYIIPLAADDLALENVGGKGMSLSRLAQAGLPVPDGFHITTSAYRQFVSANHLQARILEALEAADPTQPASLDAASLTIQALFMAGQVPGDVHAAIEEAYLGLGDQTPVAVRSSATAEDLPGLSFAGQQDTYLNITDSEEVHTAVKRCWASLWTARAMGYRIKHHIDQNTISLAVVVQALIPAEAAGVLFTADPVTGQRDHLIINAAWGLGETVVGGLVTPDMVRVDKRTDAILLRQTAEKCTMTVRTPGGTIEQVVPEALQNTPVLSDEQVTLLTHLGIRIEQLYGGPMDIEWAFADGQFAILQARPITALPEPPAPDWILPDPKGKYARMSIAELVPDPLSPMFMSLGLPAMGKSIFKVMDELVQLSPEALPEDWMVAINGYLYYSLNFTPKQWWLIITQMLPRTFEMMRTGILYWQDIALPLYNRTTARWNNQELERLSAKELLQGINELVEVFSQHLATLMISTMGPSAGSEGLFTLVYEKLIKRPGDPSAPTFLMGFDSIPIQADKNLYDLASWCRKQPALADYLTGVTTAQIRTKTTTLPPPAAITGDIWQEWLARIHDHLERFGYSIYDMDFTKPLPMDDPKPILETLKLFIRDESKNPHRRQQAYTEQREKAVQEMFGRLKGIKRWAFEKSLHWAQTQAPMRENGIAEIGLGYPILRRIFMELGSRLTATGTIEQPEDIYWLDYSELEAAVAAQEKGVSVPERILAIAERKALWQAQKKLTPLAGLPSKTKFFGVGVEKMVSFRSADEQTNTIVGTGTSPGLVTAPACVIQSTEDFSQMRPGDVLVATITTPAWTPLFLLASAVVTDIGGPLSHGSIVAREYGIPAVLGTGNATRRIHTGQRITVNGSAGIVTFAENGKDSPELTG